MKGIHIYNSIAEDIYSIGRPEYGRLGLGDCDDVMVTPTKIVNIKNASCISARSLFTIIYFHIYNCSLKIAKIFSAKLFSPRKHLQYFDLILNNYSI